MVRALRKSRHAHKEVFDHVDYLDRVLQLRRDGEALDVFFDLQEQIYDLLLQEEVRLLVVVQTLFPRTLLLLQRGDHLRPALQFSQAVILNREDVLEVQTLLLQLVLASTL